MAFQFGFLHVVGAATIAAFVLSKTTTYSLLTVLPWIYLATIPTYAVLYSSYIYPFYISELRHVPTVPGFPLWGQFLTIITTECGEAQRQWHETHGPIIRYFFPFGAERLSIADDKAIHQMTVKNPYNYPKPVRAKLWMVRILGEGVLLAEGSEHVHQRKALAPGFSIASIRALTPVFWQKSLLLATLWKDEMAESRVTTKCFEVLEWLNRTTLDIIGQAGFGTDINSLENPDTPIREAYRLVFAFDIGSRILHGLQAFIPSTKYIPAKMNRDMEAARGIIVDKATEIITEKENQALAHSKHKDIIALISKDNLKMKEAGEEGLSFETMRDQVMTFLGAGHDTTATGVAWTLHLLSKYPAIQERLRKEIKQHMPFLFDPATRFNPEQLAKADADQLPYLDNVCRESLRYIPPIPMTVRQSLAVDQLGPYTVPAGTVIYILANSINRLPMYWGPTADKFDPDRWDNLPETYTTNAFMTFLQGPRGCVGRKFAETEMKILVCCLLSMFRFEMDKGVEDPESLKMWRLVLRPRDGVSLKVSQL
ncbi:related to isotrichodermin C-15 hydroxylase (cytochrome P-450 monooxygenase CYP65A1) [Phialocephala subalpina]|uniref:Related to isotrichodermin C-15 hydroxylase (Cytochrome P-450 monooxygenase CYP65A1) n=1 Tax=Phialocephala subalpina TaxID=576137 RepID=A0A1L7WIE0_9HELO|nr:related to isotrichodermin C-15 hydroxylase (cytochrome P-450 monooxygenase CYP65A1) [Phialocephala subalpina]